MNVLLLLYYLVFLATVFVWPSWRVWRREGINPLVLPRDDSAEGFVGLWFKGLIGAILAVLTATAVGLDPEYLGGIAWLDGPWARWTGLFALAVSLPLVMAAQAAMGRSWRIGIAAGQPVELVTEGIFARSRNPVFLGLRINLLGLVLMLPTAATVAIWLLGEVLMGVQVRLEEANLQVRAGSAYDSYRKRVPRWI